MLTPVPTLHPRPRLAQLRTINEIKPCVRPRARNTQRASFTSICLYPAGTSNFEGSTGADEKLESCVVVSISTTGPAGAFEFAAGGGGSAAFFLPNPNPPRCRLLAIAEVAPC